MLFQDDHLRKFNDWHGIDRNVTPQNSKETYWLKLKTLHFHFSDPRSH